MPEPFLLSFQQVASALAIWLGVRLVAKSRVSTPQRRLSTYDYEYGRFNQLTPAAVPVRDLDPFLPYAITLDAKEAWGNRLSQTFFASAVVAEE
jgi:hypothetical protein